MVSFNMKKALIMGCLSGILVMSLMTGCSKKENNSSQVKNNVDSSQKIEKSSNTNDSEKDVNNDKQEETVANPVKSKSSGGIQFVKKEVDSGTKIVFNTPWKNSEDGIYSACVDGRGSEGVEEGKGKVIVKGNGKIYSFEIENNDKKTPKYVEWADNKNLLVVVGYPMGTVSKGGNLYMLNIDSGEVYLVLNTPSDKQEITSLQKQGSKLMMKVNAYDDDNYNKSHTENWSIDNFDPSLNSKMEVKDSSGKTILEI